MGYQNFSNKHKVCATCAYWSGNRKIIPGKYVKAESNEKAKCIGGGHDNVLKNPSSSCAKWQLWPPIR